MSTVPLLTTKLHLPRTQPSHVQRPRLIQQLLEANPVTLISAPPGFGKTTLLREWIPLSPHCVTWLSLDDGDNDAARFWSYFIASLQTLDERLGAAALRLLQSSQPPAWETIVSVVLNDLAAFEPHFICVLDDYHVIDERSIHAALAFLIDHLPDRMRVVLTSRSDPPLPVARWRVRGQLTEIRADDLRFTSDEAAVFLNQLMGLQLSIEDVQVLDARTEGWAAGLQLAALSLRDRTEVASFIRGFSGNYAYIIDYLAEEVLARQSPEVREFLLHTAILDRMCAALCDTLLDQTTSQTMLEQLERANLFLIPLDDERRWYRYHHLFADVLRARWQPAPPDQLRDLHRRASAWFEQSGFLNEAIQHGLAAADLDRAASLIERAADDLRKRSEYHTLQRWLERLPDELVRSRPRLSLERTRLLLHAHELDAVEPYLQIVEQTPVGDPQADRLRNEARLMAARLANRRNRFEEALEISQQALASIPPDQMLLRGQALSIFGVAAYYCEQTDASLRAFAEAATCALAAGDIYTALNAITNDAIVSGTSGRLRAAAQTYRRGLELARVHGAEYSLMTSLLHLNLTAVLYEWNQLDEAHTHARVAIEINRHNLDPYPRLMSHVLLARVLRAHGDLPQASQQLDIAWALAREHTLPTLSLVDLQAIQVRVWLAQGNLAALSDWVQAEQPRICDSLSAVQEPEQVALARALIALGALDEACAWLARLHTAAYQARRAAVQIEVQALQASALSAHGDLDEARTLLTRTLEQAEPEGYIRTFVDEGAALRTLIADVKSRAGQHSAGANGDQTARLSRYADRLLAAFPPVVDGETAATQSARPARQNLIDPLSDRELEVLRLVADGLSDRQVAEKLIVAVGTVKRHLNSVYGKLGVHSRTQALVRARDLNLL